MAELTKEDVMQITGVRGPDKWSQEKRVLLQVVALAAFDVREAAEALLSDVRDRHPGEELRCPHMRKLDEAVKKAAAVGKPPPFTRG